MEDNADPQIKSLVCVEFPGKVQNVDRAIQCLGGLNKISQVRSLLHFAKYFTRLLMLFSILGMYRPGEIRVSVSTRQSLLQTSNCRSN